MFSFDNSNSNFNFSTTPYYHLVVYALSFFFWVYYFLLILLLRDFSYLGPKLLILFFLNGLLIWLPSELNKKIVPTKFKASIPNAIHTRPSPPISRIFLIKTPLNIPSFFYNGLLLATIISLIVVWINLSSSTLSFLYTESFPFILSYPMLFFLDMPQSFRKYFPWIYSIFNLYENDSM